MDPFSLAIHLGDLTKGIGPPGVPPILIYPLFGAGSWRNNLKTVSPYFPRGPKSNDNFPELRTPTRVTGRSAY